MIRLDDPFLLENGKNAGQFNHKPTSLLLIVK